MYFALSFIFLTSAMACHLTDGFEVSSTTTPDGFPVQVPNPADQKSFFRITGQEVEEISCPLSYVFDAEQLICVKAKEEDEPVCLYLNLTEGYWPNPDNCRSMFGCNAQCCFRMYCPPELLYNAAMENCSYPLEAGCCEYKEKNPDRLVQ